MPIISAVTDGTLYYEHASGAPSGEWLEFSYDGDETTLPALVRESGDPKWHTFNQIQFSVNLIPDENIVKAVVRLTYTEAPTNGIQIVARVGSAAPPTFYTDPQDVFDAGHGATFGVAAYPDDSAVAGDVLELDITDALQSHINSRVSTISSVVIYVYAWFEVGGAASHTFAAVENTTYAEPQLDLWYGYEMTGGIVIGGTAFVQGGSNGIHQESGSGGAKCRGTATVSITSPTRSYTIVNGSKDAYGDAWDEGSGQPWYTTTTSLSLYNDYWGGYYSIGALEFNCDLEPGATVTSCHIKMRVAASPSGSENMSLKAKVCSAVHTIPTSWADATGRAGHTQASATTFLGSTSVGTEISLNVTDIVTTLVAGLTTRIDRICFILLPQSIEEVSSAWYIASEENATYAAPKLEWVISGSAPSPDRTGSGGAECGGSVVFGSGIQFTVSSTNDAYVEDWDTESWYDSATNLSLYYDSMYGSRVAIRFPIALQPDKQVASAIVRLTLISNASGYGTGVTVTPRVFRDTSTFPSNYTTLTTTTSLTGTAVQLPGTHTTGQTVDFDVTALLQELANYIGSARTHVVIHFYGTGDESNTGYYNFASEDHLSANGPQLLFIAEGADLATTTHNISGSGGVKAAGTALRTHRFRPTVTGGTVTSGTALVGRRTFNTATGGAVAGGTNQAYKGHSVTATGGMKAAGSILNNIIAQQFASGGVIIPQTYSEVEDGGAFNEAGSGGVVLGGEVTELYFERNLYPDGGSVCSGTCEVYSYKNPANSGGMKVVAAEAKNGFSQYLTFRIQAGKVAETIEDFVWLQRVPLAGETIYLRKDGVDVPFALLETNLEEEYSYIMIKHTITADADTTFDVVAMN